MKIIKKISALLLTLCLLVPSFSMIAHAADGRISFTDPQTAVGEMVEVKCVARSTSGAFGDVKIVLSYDKDFLRFDSGENVNDDGKGTLTVTGTNGSSESATLVKFQALKEGTTKIEISSVDATDGNGLSLELDEGSSAVTIAAGDPSKITEGNNTTSNSEDVQVEVNGTAYTLTDDFADTDIPNGYSRTQVALDGQDRQMVENETGNIVLAYLKDADSTGDFFLYNEEDATFSPYEEVAISDTTSIVILSDTSKVKLPETYKEAKLTLNDKEFPVWQDSEHEGYYVMYAMNSNGETGYYQYDSNEGTYQRFEVSSETKEEKADTSSLMGKIQNFIEKNIQRIVLFGGLGAILVLLIIIILATKLRHRNSELDDLYDEYGIDMDEEAEVEPVKAAKAPKKEKASLFGKKKKYEDDEFDEYDDEEDDFDDYEEDFDDADYEDDYEEDFEEDVFEEEAYDVVGALDQDVFSAYDSRSERDELSIDDLDDLLSERPVQKRSHMEEDDTFKVDFIDLD